MTFVQQAVPVINREGELFNVGLARGVTRRCGLRLILLVPKIRHIDYAAQSRQTGKSYYAGKERNGC